MAIGKKNTIVFKQSLPDVQYKKLFKQATEEGTTVQEIVRRLIYTHLSDNGNKL